MFAVCEGLGFPIEVWCMCRRGRDVLVGCGGIPLLLICCCRGYIMTGVPAVGLTGSRAVIDAG